MLTARQEKQLENGINVHKLKIGTLLLVVTKNSLYKIIKTSEDQYSVSIEGGKYFKEPTQANFSGSTFGGSMMKIGWIGHGMNMEIYVPKFNTTYKTTYVRAAKVIGDGWEYSMDWNENDI